MIVYISAGTLIIVFLIAVIGIILANRANGKSMSEEEVVCAGSVDNSYPETIKMKLMNDPMIGLTPEERNSLRRYVVKGNSMQYANINTNDFVYVKDSGIDAIRQNLPKICLLMFSPKSPKLANKKIRRTWRIINSDISDADFETTLEDILNSERFNELRSIMGTRCPSDNELKRIARESLGRYRNAHNLQQEELLLSTTYRTERNRLEFSIHPSSSLQGIVAYVSHPIANRSA